MINRLELNWKLDGFVDEQRYYCSETPIDPENLPAPKMVLTGDVRSYVDIAVEVGKTYYIAVGSVKNGVEKLSSVVTVVANELYKNKFFNLSDVSFYAASSYIANADEMIGGLEFGTTIDYTTPVAELTASPEVINFDVTFDFTFQTIGGTNTSIMFLCRSAYFGNSYAKCGTFIFITRTYVGIGYGSNAETGASANTDTFYTATSANVKHSCRIVGNGSIITVYIDNVLIKAFTDTKYAETSGKFGFSTYPDGGVKYKIEDLKIQVL